MFVSTISFACMNAIVKHLEHVNAYQIVFFRSASCLVFTFAFLLKNKIPVLGNKRKLLVLRGVVGVISMTFFFMSTKYLPIGTAVTLRYLAPIFATIFAIFLLKEQVKHIQWLFFLIAFSGVVVLKGVDDNLNSYGLLLAFVSAFFSGLVYVVISLIGKKEHPVVIVNYFMFISTIVGGLLAIKDWIWPVGRDWWLLCSLGCFGYFGQIYMTKAFQGVQTNQITPFKFLEVVFTLLLGVTIFSEKYSFWSLLGIALIVLGLSLNLKYRNNSKRIKD